MKTKLTLFLLLAIGIGAATAGMHPMTTTDSGTTTTAIQTIVSATAPATTTHTLVMNPMELIDIVASVIDVNATDPDIVTYLVNCAGPSDTPSAASASTTGGTATDTDSDECSIPPGGLTFVHGPNTLGSTVTDTREGPFSEIADACTRAAATSESMTCTETRRGADDPWPPQVWTIATWEIMPMYLYVTAGVEKVLDASASAARTAASTGGAAAAKMASSTGSAAAAKMTSSIGSSAASTGAALKMLPTMGMAGALGVIAAVVWL